MGARLNPLKSGQTSGLDDIYFGQIMAEESQSPQIGANFRTEWPGGGVNLLQPGLNPLKSGQTSGHGKSEIITCGSTSQSPQIGANFRTRPPPVSGLSMSTVSIPSNRGKLPDHLIW